ncbi:hypothetical protein TL16_g00713 [Triparma laevis f. inornata]|nr:hypothetical protein TL16_g00713 [Triparma laevis f. inornata]GMI01955.1 hypothetical protein TrLO_g8142 [Triparma laevis f. longispina]
MSKSVATKYTEHNKSREISGKRGAKDEEDEYREGILEAAAAESLTISTYEVRVTLVGGRNALRTISSPESSLPSSLPSLPASPRSQRYFISVTTVGLSFFTTHPFPADRSKTLPGTEICFLSFLKLIELQTSTKAISPLTLELIFETNNSKIILTTLNSEYVQRKSTVDELLKARQVIQARDRNVWGKFRRFCEESVIHVHKVLGLCCPVFMERFAYTSKRVKKRR